MSSRWWRVFVTCGLFAVALPACMPATPDTTGDAELLPVTLAVSRECMSAAVYVADTNGAFAEAGLDVTIVEYPSSQPCMEALVAGEVDAATCADTPIVFAALDGEPFDVLATIASSDNDIKVLVRADREVEHPRELAGRCVATAPRTAAHAFLSTFLARYGIAPDDIELCLVPFPEAAKGLIDGTYGVAALREPFIGEVLDALGEEVVVFEEPGLYLKTMNLCVDETLAEDVRERLMRALIASEPGRGDTVCEQAVEVVAERLGQEQADACDALCAGEYAIRLDQALILALEDQARWAIASGLADVSSTPDFLARFDMTPLDRVEPSRIEVIR